jgi:glutamate-1-semialdehyde 2,1-aminomutase
MHGSTIAILIAVASASFAVMLRPLQLRLQLSRAKHPSLVGHAHIGRLCAALLPFYEYDEARFFCADDAPTAIVERRRAGFTGLAALYTQRFASTVRLTQEVQNEMADLQFTARYRVPFQFSRLVREHLNAGVFVDRLWW